MIAILSDVHGNFEALQAVVQDASRWKADSFVFLGDLVGYGPSPFPCIEAAMDWNVVLQGDFDDAVRRNHDLASWPPVLRQMIHRLRQQLNEHPRGEEFREFLTECPTYHFENETLFVHGTPRDHLHEYIFPEHIHDGERMTKVFSGFGRLCFGGHSHIPGIYTPGDCSAWVFISPDECDNTYRLKEPKVLCNVGSVGQPRDGDPRACYVLFDGSTICFRRIDYDIETTVDKIRSGDDDDMHGDRLRFGR